MLDVHSNKGLTNINTFRYRYMFNNYWFIHMLVCISGKTSASMNIWYNRNFFHREGIELCSFYCYRSVYMFTTLIYKRNARFIFDYFQ
ncbi:Uncharacterised protein [Mycobacteroides abscessus subsp. abscessus]|nr:Uncharacterised protein [Mycobacteroides abscessus]SIN58686.1 Uncharacterised protein [Mycobacteroides abscessus subsp. abscessus]